ncbi:hypothetical protein Pelo_2100 [Pelomyxa schiedti]|nr:hypothetical protein Pelo_2100 [Pelomyxa schiedti]
MHHRATSLTWEIGSTKKTKKENRRSSSTSLVPASPSSSSSSSAPSASSAAASSPPSSSSSPAFTGSLQTNSGGSGSGNSGGANSLVGSSAGNGTAGGEKRKKKGVLSHFRLPTFAKQTVESNKYKNWATSFHSLVNRDVMPRFESLCTQLAAPEKKQSVISQMSSLLENLSESLSYVYDTDKTHEYEPVVNQCLFQLWAQLLTAMQLLPCDDIPLTFLSTLAVILVRPELVHFPIPKQQSAAQCKVSLDFVLSIRYRKLMYSTLQWLLSTIHWSPTPVPVQKNSPELPIVSTSLPITIPSQVSPQSSEPSQLSVTPSPSLSQLSQLPSPTPQESSNSQPIWPSKSQILTSKGPTSSEQIRPLISSCRAQTRHAPPQYPLPSPPVKCAQDMEPSDPPQTAPTEAISQNLSKEPQPDTLSQHNEIAQAHSNPSHNTQIVRHKSVPSLGSATTPDQPFSGSPPLPSSSPPVPPPIPELFSENNSVEESKNPLNTMDKVLTQGGMQPQHSDDECEFEEAESEGEDELDILLASLKKLSASIPATDIAPQRTSTNIELSSTPISTLSLYQPPQTGLSQVSHIVETTVEENKPSSAEHIPSGRTPTASNELNAAPESNTTSLSTLGGSSSNSSESEPKDAPQTMESQLDPPNMYWRSASRILAILFFRIPCFRRVLSNSLPTLPEIYIDTNIDLDKLDIQQSLFPCFFQWDPFHSLLEHVMPDSEDISFIEVQKTKWIEIFKNSFLVFFKELLLHAKFLVASREFEWCMMPSFHSLVQAFLSSYTNQKPGDSVYLVEIEDLLLSVDPERVVNALIRLFYAKTCALDIMPVLDTLTFMDRWFTCLTRHKQILGSEFDTKFMCQGFEVIIDVDHHSLLVRVLNLLYKHADLFFFESRLFLFLEFLLNRWFLFFFLHWSNLVRSGFYQVLLLQRSRKISKSSHLSDPSFDMDAINRQINTQIEAYLGLVMQTENEPINTHQGQPNGRTNPPIKPSRHDVYVPVAKREWAQHVERFEEFLQQSPNCKPPIVDFL